MAAGSALSSYTAPEPAGAERAVHALSLVPGHSLDTQRARTPDLDSRSTAVLAGLCLQVREPAVPLGRGSPGRAAPHALTSGAYGAGRDEPLRGPTSPNLTALSPVTSPPRQARASAPRPAPARLSRRRGNSGLSHRCFVPHPGLGKFAAETKVN